MRRRRIMRTRPELTNLTLPNSRRRLPALMLRNTDHSKETTDYLDETRRTYRPAGLSGLTGSEHGIGAAARARLAPRSRPLTVELCGRAAGADPPWLGTPKID